MILIGRGLFVILIIWMIGLFLIWELISNRTHHASDKGGFTNCHGRHDFRSKQKTSMIPVHIVEEHHEVIKYWYSAVEKRHIPSKGNILFHIDAHSDGGIPSDWYLGPLFRKPQDASDIGKMMQGNDRFVMAAVLAGLITRYIWVWPPWNTNSFEKQAETDYINFNVRIGTTHIVMKDGTKMLELCACAMLHDYGLDKYCFMNNASDSADVDGIPIQESECVIRTSVLVEVMGSDTAREFLESGTWITADESVILDVDEDYYGVEAGGQPLYDVGLTDDQMDTLGDWSANLLCAGSTLHERRIDRFFHSLIQAILDFKTLHSRNKNKRQPNKTIMKRFALTFKKTIGKNGLKRLLCHSWTKSLFVLRNMIEILIKMTNDQLKALAKVGLCLETSPKTYGFKYGSTMRLCSGYNTPNRTMVMFYTPSRDDIKARTREIEQLLVQDYFVPGVVTICRSVRDGYTPRNLSGLIEREILDVLQNQYSQINTESIYYDNDLLSGPDGHYVRY